MTEPTDAELTECYKAANGEDVGKAQPLTTQRIFRAMRAAIAKWGTPPAVAGEPVGWMWQHDETGRTGFVDCWQVENGWQENNTRLRLVSKLYAPPPPTQAQAGAVPLTPIRQAALDLYKPPFRHEHGYIRDANNQIVSDDASSVATGLIAARIRGWGRIQYMDKPEMRANALQDEVAEMVAEALNAYWAANGIKGGQHGADT